MALSVAREGPVEEAILHFINAGEVHAASDLVEGNLQAIIDKDLSRRVLGRRLPMISRSVEEQRLWLIVAHINQCILNWNLPRLSGLLDKGQALVAVPDPAHPSQQLRECLRGLLRHRGHSSSPLGLKPTDR